MHEVTAMISKSLKPRAYFSPNVMPPEGQSHHSVASYQGALTKQKNQLREVRGRTAFLLSRSDKLMRLPEAFRELFSLRDDAAIRVASLTSRQRQIMEHVLAGKLSKTIAWELGISQRTVENHRAAIMRKTGSRSLPALARLALAAALNDPRQNLAQPHAGLVTGAAWSGTTRPNGEIP
jgi:DNA-binding NarL/FixJ family response regulator